MGSCKLRKVARVIDLLGQLALNLFPRNTPQSLAFPIYQDVAALDILQIDLLLNVLHNRGEERLALA